MLLVHVACETRTVWTGKMVLEWGVLHQVRWAWTEGNSRYGL